MPESNPLTKLFNYFSPQNDTKSAAAIQKELQAINQKLYGIQLTLENLPLKEDFASNITIRQAHLKQCNAELHDLHRRLSTVNENISILTDPDKSACDQVYNATRALFSEINSTEEIQDFVSSNANQSSANNPFMENPLYGQKVPRYEEHDSSPTTEDVNPPTPKP